MRLSLSNRLENLALDFLQDLVEVRYTREKTATLRRMNLRLSSTTQREWPRFTGCGRSIGELANTRERAFDVIQEHVAESEVLTVVEIRCFVELEVGGVRNWSDRLISDVPGTERAHPLRTPFQPCPWPPATRCWECSSDSPPRGTRRDPHPGAEPSR